MHCNMPTKIPSTERLSVFFITHHALRSSTRLSQIILSMVMMHGEQRLKKKSISPVLPPISQLITQEQTAIIIDHYIEAAKQRSVDCTVTCNTCCGAWFACVLCLVCLVVSYSSCCSSFRFFRESAVFVHLLCFLNLGEWAPWGSLF